MVLAVNNIPRDQEETMGRAANSGKHWEPLRVRRTREYAASLRLQEMLQKTVDKDNFNQT